MDEDFANSRTLWCRQPQYGMKHVEEGKGEGEAQSTVSSSYIESQWNTEDDRTKPDEGGDCSSERGEHSHDM